MKLHPPASDVLALPKRGNSVNTFIERTSSDSRWDAHRRMNKAVANCLLVEYLKGDYDTQIYGSTLNVLTLVSYTPIMEAYDRHREVEFSCLRHFLNSLILDIPFKSSAASRVRVARSASCPPTCNIGIEICVRTFIGLLVAVKNLIGESVVTSPLGSLRPSTIHLSDVEG